MARRYGGYRRDKSYWRGDSCSDDYEAFPKFKIVCESENHIGYINVPPKAEYQNPEGYALILPFPSVSSPADGFDKVFEFLKKHRSYAGYLLKNY